jgi:transketolase
MIHLAGSGHPGGSLSAVEILTSLYFDDIFQCDVNDPDKKERDRLVLSKGHCAPVLYSVLCRKGFFEEKELATLRKLGSNLQGHPYADKVNGLDVSSGSLGQGLSVANGIALGYKKQNINNRVYCLLGDGELQEGQVWEAALTAAQFNLDNICAIVDNNHVQLDGRTEEIKKMEPVIDKWVSFGWNVIPVDGHDVASLSSAYQQAMKSKGRPTVIIAETIKGKGVSFMEDKCEWHGLAPDKDQLKLALAELEEIFV